jgi:hypothetical protein
MAGALNATELGVFNVHSVTVHTHSTLAEVVAQSERYFERVPSRHAGYKVRIQRSSAKPPDSLDGIQALLTNAHERDHFLKYATTPFGCLVWTIWNDLTSAATWLVRKCSETGISEQIEAPIFSWFVDRGHVAFQAAEFTPPTEAFMKHVRETAKDLRTYKAGLNVYARELAQAYHENFDFLAAFHGRTALSLAEFTRLAGSTLGALWKQADVSLKVRHRSDGQAHHLPKGGFSVHEILEASARLTELECMIGIGASDAILDEWEKRSIFGVYEPAYRYVLEELGSPNLARMAIDLACMGPLDPSCGIAHANVLHIEDIHPSWRLPRIVEAMQDLFAPGNREDFTEWVRAIEIKAGLPRQHEFLKGALDKPRFPIDWAADSKVYGVGRVTSEFSRYYETEILRAYRVRLADPVALVRPKPGEVEVFQPALEFYSDRALMHVPPGFTAERDFALGQFTSLSINLIGMALITGQPVTGFSSLLRRFVVGRDASAARQAQAEERLRKFIDGGFPQRVVDVVRLWA